MKNLLQKVFLAYIRFFARLQLKKNPKAKIIGITGSAGKTSTKHAIYAAIEDSFRTKLCVHGNSETGIPLDILGLMVNDYSMLDWLRLAILCKWKLLTNWERFDVLIVEMAVDSPFFPKNMDYLLSIVQPEIGVFLNVSSVHGANYEPLLKAKGLMVNEEQIKQLIANEKSKLIASLPENGIAVLNKDDPLIFPSAKQTHAKVITFGKDSDISLADAEFSLDHGSTFVITNRNDRVEIRFKNHVLGRAYGYSFLCAVAVATALGIPFVQSAKALEKNFELPPSRMSLLRGIHNSRVIDSSYNASALSTEELITTCKNISAPHKIVVLGDMREIGTAEKEVHIRIAKRALEVFDHVILIGELFDSVKSSILKVAPSAKAKLAFFERAGQAVEIAKSFAKPGALFAVKGSQNTLFLEIIVEALLADKADLKLVCRQEPYWQKQKAPFRN